MERRERTHHLIELGGFVQKAGLVELCDDDRATLYGALLSLCDTAAGESRSNVVALWRRRGQRAFAADQDAQGSGAGGGSAGDVEMTPPAPRGRP